MTPTRLTTAIALPGHRAPATGLDSPFEMLEACHERVHRMLGLLQRLRAHLLTHGRDEDAHSAATDVMRYFDLAAPLHHQDEERHVFPLTMTSRDEHLQAATAALLHDHRVMEALWPQVRTLLQTVTLTQAPWCPWTNEDQALVSRFVDLYEQHLRTEDDVVYPAANARMGADALRTMSQDMMARRGVTPTKPG